MLKNFRAIWISLITVILIAATFSACGGGSSGGGGSGENASTASTDPLTELKGRLGKDEPEGTIKDPANAPDRDNTPKVLTSDPGDKTFAGNGATVDFSNINSGYIMAKYQGDNPKIKIQITGDSDKNTYTYDLQPNADFNTFPIQKDGNYTVAVFTNISGDQYSQACAQSLTAKLIDQFQPFLRPNQYCWYTDQTQAVAQGATLSKGAKSDLKVIENIFGWIVTNVKYDYELAKTVQSGYVPNVDHTLTAKTGICFDYASLMTCMLRTQGIPCQLEVGYAGKEYHAWINVYVSGKGLVYHMIQFNGDTWTLMDPTFAASGDISDPNTNTETAYNPIYFY